MGQRMQEIVNDKWSGHLIPEYVPKWHGKPYHHPWGWLAVTLGAIVGTGMVMLFCDVVISLLIGAGPVEPAVGKCLAFLLCVGLALVLPGFGLAAVEYRRQERKREYDKAHEYVLAWVKQYGLRPEYEPRRCLHILACLAHLVHHSTEVEEAATRKFDLRQAEQFMYFLYGEVFERDFADKLDVRELRSLVSVAELQRPDALISNHYRTYRGYREGGRAGVVCIMDIQSTAA